MDNERRGWRLEISLTRGRPKVKAERREEVEPGGSTEGQVYSQLAGLVEQVAQGGGERYLRHLGDKKVSHLLEEVPEIQDIVTALESRDYGLPDEDVERLHLALARYAEQMEEKPVHPGRILGAATR